MATSISSVTVLGLAGSQPVLPLVFPHPSPSATVGTQTPNGLVNPTDPSSSLDSVAPTSPSLLSTPLPGVGVSPTPTSAVTTTGPYGITDPTQLSAAGVPQVAYHAYVEAAAKLANTDGSCRLSWSVLAALGRVESNHGQYAGSTLATNGVVTPAIFGIRLDGSTAGTSKVSDTDKGKYDFDTVVDRAVGPLQLLPAPWKTYGGTGNPQSINDAALAAGRYLCAGSNSLATAAGRWKAVYRYNHSDSYVSLVLSLADTYATGQKTAFPTRPSGITTSATASAATTPGAPPALSSSPASSLTTTTPTPSSTTATPTPTATTPRATPTTAPTTTPTTKPTTTPTTAPPTTAVPTTTPPATTTIPPVTVPPTTAAVPTTTTPTATALTTTTPSTTPSPATEITSTPPYGLTIR